MLTNAAVKAARFRDRPYKMWDERGLYLLVVPNGRRTWLLRSRSNKRERLLTIGSFPELDVAAARERAEEQRQRLVSGGGQSQTFEQIARSWHDHSSGNWSNAHADDVMMSLERDVFPIVGSLAANSIEPLQLLEVLRAVEARGKVETARRQRYRLSAIFRFGIAEGLLASDPAATLGAAMRPKPLGNPMAALLEIDECRSLLAACANIGGGTSAEMASRFLALTAVRWAAVRGMRWCEIDDLDGDLPTWTVPAERMKLSFLKKESERFAHAVPLSRQAVAVLREAREQFAQNAKNPAALVFPGRRGGAPIGEGTVLALYRRTHFAGRHVPHGWRASFSTILNEELGPEWRWAIDGALAHSAKDVVEASYNRAKRIDRRRALFDRWGELLAG